MPNIVNHGLMNWSTNEPDRDTAVAPTAPVATAPTHMPRSTGVTMLAIANTRPQRCCAASRSLP